jgi:hypothetical protein
MWAPSLLPSLLLLLLPSATALPAPLPTDDLVEREAECNADLSMTRVRAQLLIPGDGDPVPKAELLYYNSNGTIYSVGPQSNAKAPTNVTNEISVPVLMPGLFDAHTHFVGTMCAKNPDHNKAVLGSLNIGWSPKKYENFACAVAQLKEALCACAAAQDLDPQHH